MGHIALFCFDFISIICFCTGYVAPVMWITSHCKTTSLREDYVQQLRKDIKVHRYGDCKGVYRK